MINFGIIGAGMIAEKHIAGLQKTGKVNISWVARKNEAGLKAIQEKYGIPRGTVNYQEVLDDKTVEAVVLCTPPAMHYEMFKAAVKAGKHVLLEKPAAIHAHELDDMIELSLSHPELLISDCSARHARLQPKFQKVKELIDSGALGEIYFIHHNAVARQSRPGIEYHPSAKWFLNRSIAGGGVLFDWGVYDLSFHMGLLNDEPEVTSSKLLFMKDGLDKKDPETDVFDVEEHFAAQLELSNGVKYYWERATNANMEAKNETRIYGTRGGIKLSFCSWESPDIEFFDVSENGSGKAQSTVFTIDMEGHDDNDALSKHFVNALSGNESLQMSLELARKHLRIIQELYRQAGR